MASASDAEEFASASEGEYDHHQEDSTVPGHASASASAHTTPTPGSPTMDTREKSPVAVESRQGLPSPLPAQKPPPPNQPAASQGQLVRLVSDGVFFADGSLTRTRTAVLPTSSSSSSSWGGWGSFLSNAVSAVSEAISEEVDSLYVSAKDVGNDELFPTKALYSCIHHSCIRRWGPTRCSDVCRQGVQNAGQWKYHVTIWRVQVSIRRWARHACWRN
jgi:hypothetical protein